MASPKQRTGGGSDREVIVPHDPVNEQVVFAAALADPQERKRLLKQLRPDRFMVKEHIEGWRGLGEMDRKGLAYDPATLQQILGPTFDISYVLAIADARPDVPENLAHHVGTLLWDHARVTAATGPVSAFLEVLKDPTAEPDRVRSLARQIPDAFDGYQDRQFLLNTDDIVRTQIEDIRARKLGRARHRFGIEGLDDWDESADANYQQATSSLSLTGTPRLLPGAAPGMVTVVTGVPGGGKSTATARIALGLARQRRRVLYGAWEMQAPMTLELLACMSLEYSRSALMVGNISEENLALLAERMTAIGKYVRFMANPFRRLKNEKPSNERNLDLIQGYISDSACDVFIADLWKRCLVRTDPADEEEALYRQQAIADETRCHCILVQQQRSKDVEQRPDKRPTREGVKGSGAWTEIADTMLGVHRPALWKSIEDNIFEIDILKQRYGRWPIAVEFDWDGDRGSFINARSVRYEQSASVGDENQGFMLPPKRRGKR